MGTKRSGPKTRSKPSSAGLTVVTLGVRNLARSRAFYCDGLGLHASSGSNEHIV
jgi:hypothetical protein